MGELIPSPTAVIVRPRPWTVFSSGSFRKLWAANTLSLFGDFFSYVAMAWLVLQLTGSSLALRTVLVVQGVPRAVLMVVGGALGVGIPTLAHGRFAAGAAGLGILFGAWGVGATAGALGAGFVAPPKRFGWLIVLLCAWLGVGVSAVGLVPSLLPAALVMGLSGIGTGVVNTYAVSWLQRRTDSAMQGRVMSLVMLASFGLAPVAY